MNLVWCNIRLLKRHAHTCRYTHHIFRRTWAPFFNAFSFVLPFAARRISRRPNAPQRITWDCTIIFAVSQSPKEILELCRPKCEHSSRSQFCCASPNRCTFAMAAIASIRCCWNSSRTKVPLHLYQSMRTAGWHVRIQLMWHVSNRKRSFARRIATKRSRAPRTMWRENSATGFRRRTWKQQWACVSRVACEAAPCSLCRIRWAQLDHLYPKSASKSPIRRTLFAQCASWREWANQWWICCATTMTLSDACTPSAHQQVARASKHFGHAIRSVPLSYTSQPPMTLSRTDQDMVAIRCLARNASHCELAAQLPKRKDGWPNTCWSWVLPTHKASNDTSQLPSRRHVAKPTWPCWHHRYPATKWNALATTSPGWNSTRMANCARLTPKMDFVSSLFCVLLQVTNQCFIFSWKSCSINSTFA